MTIQRVTRPTVEVLTILTEQSDPVWGLRIVKMTSLSPGTVYSLLSRLEESKLVVSSWETETERPGPRRRLYEITEHGRAVARDVISAYHAGAAPSRRPHGRPEQAF